MAISDFLKPIGGLVSSFAPMAGTLLGGMFGGPAGGALGGGLGSAVSGLLGRLTGHSQAQPAAQPQAQPQAPAQHPAEQAQAPMQAQPQQPMQQPQMQQPQMPSIGGMMQSGMNQFMPQQYHNMSFGQMGNNFQNMGANAINNMLGPQFSQYGIGQSLMGGLSNLANRGFNYLQNRYAPNMPSMNQFSQMTPMELAGHGGNMIQSRLSQMIPGMNFGQPMGGRGGEMQSQEMPQQYAYGGNVGMRHPHMFPMHRGY